ncbi:MAG: hypothetical protein AAGI66_07305 [Cyanobacteria bacterium P01_H01_bin.74]
MTQWKSDLNKKSKLITKKKVNFAFEEISKCHLHTINSAKILDDKSLLVIGGLITVSTAILGFFASQCSFDKPLPEQPWDILIPGIILQAFFWYSMRILVKALYPVKYFPPGNEPQMILTQEQFDQPLSWLIFSQAHSMQERITLNCELNNQKAKALQKSLFLVILAPITSIALSVGVLWVRGLS